MCTLCVEEIMASTSTAIVHRFHLLHVMNNRSPKPNFHDWPCMATPLHTPHAVAV